MEDRKTFPLASTDDDWRKLRDSDYLGHWDLVLNKDVTVTISSIQKEEVIHPTTKKKEIKPVLSFEGKNKRLIVNATNMAAVASWHGNNPNGWVGKKIDLFRTTTKVKGEETECVRIRHDKTAKSRFNSQKAIDSVK